MKVQKLPSGSYRVQKTINGKRKSFTFDHKPTQKEIEEEVYKSMGEVRLRVKCTSTIVSILSHLLLSENTLVMLIELKTGLCLCLLTILQRMTFRL